MIDPDNACLCAVKQRMQTRRKFVGFRRSPQPGPQFGVAGRSREVSPSDWLDLCWLAADTFQHVYACQTITQTAASRMAAAAASHEDEVQLKTEFAEALEHAIYTRDAARYPLVGPIRRANQDRIHEVFRFRWQARRRGSRDMYRAQFADVLDMSVREYSRVMWTYKSKATTPLLALRDRKMACTAEGHVTILAPAPSSSFR